MLEALRGYATLIGTKKGGDRSQCGVRGDGQRPGINACLVRACRMPATVCHDPG
jgi:aerobic-type carbon monoxide dehydrogenase small subunit (CoxS/CutS family)